MNKSLKFIIILLGIILVLAFLYAISSLVKLVIIAALLAYILDPLATALEARGLTRGIATFMLFLMTLLFLIGFLLLVLPVIRGEIQDIQKGVSEGKAKELIIQFEAQIESQLKHIGVGDINLSQNLQALSKKFGQEFFSYLRNIVTIVSNIVIIPFIMFFLLKDGREIKKRLIRVVPNKYFEESLILLYKMDLQLGNYLRGQFLDALIIGILSISALAILKVNYFVIIGAFAGLANLIPYVGPIAGAIPAIIISIMQTGDLSMVPWIILAFVIVQLADNVLVQPLVVAKTVNLHPLIVLLAVLIGGKFYGIFGMLLAVPITGVIKVVVHEFYQSYRQYSLENIGS
jgi:putative permease